MFVKLICNEENRKVVADILQSNNIFIEQQSKVVVIEDGFIDDNLYDLKISFKMEALSELINFIYNIKSNDVNMIIGKTDEAYTPINIDEICYFNAINNYTYANVDNGKSYVIKNKLYQVEKDLAHKCFIRINKSEIVNIKKIKLISPMFKGRLVIYIEGYKNPLDISRGYTKSFKERLGI